MKLLIDDARMEKIRAIYEYFPVEGVTTNPSILAASGRNPYDVLTEIRAFIGDEADLHVQVISRDAQGMQQEAHAITARLGGNTLVKIPSVKEGFKAMKALHKEGIRITATAVYTPIQAFLAAGCGAEYVAPYINRIDNLGYDGIQAAKEIQNIFTVNNLETKILAASFKNTRQVLALAAFGIGAATVSPEVIEGFAANPVATAAVEAFISDFESLTGKAQTMKTI